MLSLSLPFKTYYYEDLRLSVDQAGFCLPSAGIHGWCYHTQLTFITFISVVCMFVYEGGGQRGQMLPGLLELQEVLSHQMRGNRKEGFQRENIRVSL